MSEENLTSKSPVTCVEKSGRSYTGPIRDTLIVDKEQVGDHELSFKSISEALKNSDSINSETITIEISSNIYHE